MLLENKIHNKILNKRKNQEQYTTKDISEFFPLYYVIGLGIVFFKKKKRKIVYSIVL